MREKKTVYLTSLFTIHRHVSERKNIHMYKVERSNNNHTILSNVMWGFAKATNIQIFHETIYAFGAQLWSSSIEYW